MKKQVLLIVFFLIPLISSAQCFVGTSNSANVNFKGCVGITVDSTVNTRDIVISRKLLMGVGSTLNLGPHAGKFIYWPDTLKTAKISTNHRLDSLISVINAGLSSGLALKLNISDTSVKWLPIGYAFKVNNAYSWGNHAGLYPLLSGSYSNPIWITSLAASKVTGLSTVATTGSYNDLTGKPTIPAAFSISSPSVNNHITSGTAFQPRSGGHCAILVNSTLSNLVAVAGTVVIQTCPTQTGTYVTVSQDALLLSALLLTVDKSSGTILVPAGHWVKVTYAGTPAPTGVYTRWDL